jgi:hypothetical protein
MDAPAIGEEQGIADVEEDGCDIGEHQSFAPSGLIVFGAGIPTACAVGCILAPLRGLVV